MGPGLRTRQSRRRWRRCCARPSCRTAQPATLTRIGDPLNLTYTDAATGQSVGEGLPQSLYQATPAILAIVFVVAVSMGSNQLGSAVVREKDQRAMEMVITSVAPWELVAGKVAGMALLSLTQVAVWLALGVASIALIVGSEPQPMAIVVPWHAILWAALLCVPGYFLYAAVAAGLGIVAGDAQQARQLAGLLGLVLMLSFVSLATIAGQPDSGLALALTYFPLTSPIIALIRMAIVSVPEAQLVTALVILLVSLALAIWAATRIFVAAMLLYGQSLAPAQILRALRGRATAPVEGLSYRDGRWGCGTNEKEKSLMGTILVIALREFRLRVTNRSFLISAIVLPVIVLVVFGATGASGQSSGGSATQATPPPTVTPAQSATVGYVDEAHLIASLPPAVPAGSVRAYPDVAAARAALTSGEIGAYYVIPPDYLKTGAVQRVSPVIPASYPADAGSMADILVANLVPGTTGQDAGKDGTAARRGAQDRRPRRDPGVERDRRLVSALPRRGRDHGPALHKRQLPLPEPLPREGEPRDGDAAGLGRAAATAHGQAHGAGSAHARAVPHLGGHPGPGHGTDGRGDRHRCCRASACRASRCSWPCSTPWAGTRSMRR